MSDPVTTKSNTPQIVLLGHVIHEMIYFPDRTVGPVLGSPVAYGALVAARLGTPVGIVSAVGDDLPAGLLDPLQAAGVDLAGIRHAPGNCTTSAELIYDQAGNKEIRYPQRAPALRIEDIPPSYLNASIYYIATMDREVPLEVMAYLSAQSEAAPSGAAHNGAPMRRQIAIDLGGYGGAHSPRKAGGTTAGDLDTLREFIRHADLVRASVEDCQLIFGRPDLPNEEFHKEETQTAILRQLLDWGAEVAMLTLGAQGCIVATRESLFRLPAFEGKVIDTTGAGDSFFTAFLVEYMRSGDLRHSAHFAGATVIHVIERTGGVHLERMPTRQQVEERIQAAILLKANSEFGTQN